ncbi:hypothetical protein FHW89_005254 [Mucilaginibacter sp. SG564]|nr:hypothetical protein [Mucilaginibacter sp. SG564]
MKNPRLCDSRSWYYGVQRDEKDQQQQQQTITLLAKGIRM